MVEKLFRRIKLLKNTAALLAADTKVYTSEYLLLETDTGKMKVGDGVNVYASLTYVGDGASGGLALGETSATAYRGDRGKTAYDHSQVSHAPAGAQANADITKAEIEAKLTGSITSHTHAATTGSGAPSGVPAFIGAIYVDTGASPADVYIARGATGSDWVKVN